MKRSRTCCCCWATWLKGCCLAISPEKHT